MSRRHGAAWRRVRAIGVTPTGRKPSDLERSAPTCTGCLERWPLEDGRHHVPEAKRWSFGAEWLACLAQ